MFGLGSLDGFAFFLWNRLKSRVSQVPRLRDCDLSKIYAPGTGAFLEEKTMVIIRLSRSGSKKRPFLQHHCDGFS